MFAITIWTTFTVSVIAQDTVGPFDFFDIWCLRDDPDFDRTQSAAAGRGWPELTANVVSVLSPLVDPDASRGWITSSDEDPMRVLVITKAASAAKTVNTCTVGFSKVDNAAFEKAVTAKLGIGPQGIERDTERIYKKFLVSHGGSEKLVTLSLPLDGTTPGDVVASVIRASN